jgi:hypothetical protein
MFGIVPVLFSANIGMLESVDGVVLGLSELVALETFVQIPIQQIHHPFWLQILNFHLDNYDLNTIIL